MTNIKINNKKKTLIKESKGNKDNVNSKVKVEKNKIKANNKKKRIE